MSMMCTICKHPEIAAISQSLTAGQSLRAVARQFSVSKDALSRHKSHLSATPATPATATIDIPAPMPAATPSLFEQHVIRLTNALMDLESCNEDEIEERYQAAIPPLQALVHSMVDDSLERIYQRQRNRITNSWNRSGLRAKFVFLKATWRQNLAQRISQ